MEGLKPVLLVGIALLVGWIFGVTRHKDARAQLQKETEALHSSLAAAIATQVRSGRVKVGVETSDDGNVTFGVKGQLPDGRAIAMRLAEDGSVLEKSTEIPAETIPANIQSPVTKAFGDISLNGAREIIEGDQIFYELTSKSPEARMQITVRGDGAILSYSAKLKVPEPER